MLTRRQFTTALSTSVGTLAFSGLATSLTGCSSSTAQRSMATVTGYGPLINDPNGLLSLPEGFSYQIISSFGDAMSDGLRVPDRGDGMGCIPLEENKVALIRNHELSAKHLINGGAKADSPLKTPLAFDTNEKGEALPGGTSTIIYDTAKQERVDEFLSLTGTLRNCSGGVTPWGSWLTCEEAVDVPNDERSQYHGYVFEVPATAKGLVDAKPLKAMGRFLHEAAAVDPKTGIVYQTEDRGDGLFYRFVPNTYGKLHEGGKLQALAFKTQPQADTRNWDAQNFLLNQWVEATWVDIATPDSPEDDLRAQGYENGAALFARGEGIHWGDGELYFCCTNGGAKQLGQVMRYQPSPLEGQPKEDEQPGRLQLFVESEDKSVYNFGDNLTVAPNGHLIVCEDQYTPIVDNHLRGITPAGELYAFARLEKQTELAGACFSPDGSTLFVNVYSPTKTLAIRGPWESFKTSRWKK